ncbi:MAG: formylglycine-generating enzyme family protein [Candidatus Accumulibacter sp.]|uniref:formylglycine-generating enzyme family protein n=1 Tax=Accumulibacter sp. TaxID=2053492 RepID=UPI002879EB13|nr:formylglycine-generating enzyme family protein [Accumulibacter sp.]MDS4014708.1 formylglycine-generating enzyme family protein [Accumulibacter sp.]
MSLAIVAGIVGGGAIGGAGFVFLEAPAWVVLWLLLFAGIGWLGYTAEPVFDEPLPAPPPARTPEPRTAAPPPVAKEREPELPRRVSDGVLEMVELPGGKFLMGSPDSDAAAPDAEKPQHEVSVSSFRMATTPVTVALYREVMGQRERAAADDRLPVTKVSWHDAVEFCNRLSIRSGYRACYTRDGKDEWRCDWQADGYRLPTEAEWEYACRAGSTTLYSFGDDAAALGDYAWYAQNSRHSLQPVAGKLPNAWGLYDLHGNVWEWCWYWYGPYTAQASRDPRGPAKSSEWRVLRGGSFADPPAFLRSAFRVVDVPVGGVWVRGFRCVRVPPQRSTH